MAVIVRDEQFEQQLDQERKRRGHKALSRTLMKLAEERMIEIQLGQFLTPSGHDTPPPSPDAHPVPAGV